MPRFGTTRWTLVRAAKGQDGRDALERLCAQYREPTRAYLSRYAIPGMELDDLVQAFQLQLLESDLVARADPELGSFRAYLVTALRRFVSRTLETASAAKRGAGAAHVNLDNAPILADSGPTPDQAFQQAWAQAVLNSALVALRQEAERSGKHAMFDVLAPFLTEEPERDDYQRIGEQLGKKPNTVAVAVHRLRSRYRALVRAEVKQTLTEGADPQIEMDLLRHSLT